MKYILPLFLLCYIVVASCKNNSSGTTSNNSDSTIAANDSSIAKQENFFPVPEYIGGQLKMIDSLQLPLTMSVTVNGKSTSAVASDTQLRFWARQFQEPDISSDSLKKFYRETSLADQSAPSVTLSYSATNITLPMQKIDVYIKPSPDQNDKVTGIYIEKTFAVQDTLFNQKLYWKTDRNLQVNTEKRIKEKTFPVEQVKITWNPTE